jgi:hypothetical protein
MKRLKPQGGSYGNESELFLLTLRETRKFISCGCYENEDVPRKNHSLFLAVVTHALVGRLSKLSGPIPNAAANQVF